MQQNGGLDEYPWCGLEDSEAGIETIREQGSNPSRSKNIGDFFLSAKTSVIRVTLYM